MASYGLAYDPGFCPPINSMVVPHASYDFEEMPKPRGTGTYFPNLDIDSSTLASQSFIHLGLLTGLLMVMEIGLQKGFLTALKDFVLMHLQLTAVFFTFNLGTKSHYFGRTILHGGAKYRPTGRKFVVFHSSFTEKYRFEWGKIVDDWKDWNKWIKQQGGMGIQQDKSWQSLWYDEQAHLRHSGLRSLLIEILLSIRFFLYQYGLFYHLDISGQNKNFIIYLLSWVVIILIFLLIKGVKVGRYYLSDNHQLTLRLSKVVLFLGVVDTIMALSFVYKLSLMDLIVCCLAFLPTGWGLILIGQVARRKIEGTALWQFTRLFAQAYDYGMGVILFAPIACLAWLPIISAFQTRFIFNKAFSRRLRIQPILAGKKRCK